MRSMVGRWFNANEQHVLDWYHIARRFEAIGKSLIYLPHIEDFGYRLGRHTGHLSRAKWKVWHGNVYGAYVVLTSFYDGVDIHTMLAEKDSRRTTTLEQIRARVNDLCAYLTANESRLINYGKEHREGNPISTAQVESTVNQLVDLADGEEAAHALDPARCPNVASCSLYASERGSGEVHRPVAVENIGGGIRGGVTPRFFPVPVPWRHFE